MGWDVNKKLAGKSGNQLLRRVKRIIRVCDCSTVSLEMICAAAFRHPLAGYDLFSCRDGSSRGGKLISGKRPDSHRVCQNDGCLNLPVGNIPVPFQKQVLVAI